MNTAVTSPGGPARAPASFAALERVLALLLSDPRFADLAEVIGATANIEVSRDYEQLNGSYSLCAHADLVLAKYTSLADEMLAMGTPCVVHDFTPNSSGFLRPVGRHLPAGIWAEDPDDWLGKVRFALSERGAAFREWWEPHRLEVFGTSDDGTVRDRIRRTVGDLDARSAKAPRSGDTAPAAPHNPPRG